MSMASYKVPSNTGNYSTEFVCAFIMFAFRFVLRMQCVLDSSRKLHRFPRNIYAETYMDTCIQNIDMYIYMSIFCMHVYIYIHIHIYIYIYVYILYACIYIYRYIYIYIYNALEKHSKSRSC